MTKRAEKWPVIGLMMTSSAAHPRRFGYSHRQNYKQDDFANRVNRALLTVRRKNTTKYLGTTFCEKTLPGNS